MDDFHNKALYAFLAIGVILMSFMILDKSIEGGESLQFTEPASGEGREVHIPRSYRDNDSAYLPYYYVTN